MKKTAITLVLAASSVSGLGMVGAGQADASTPSKWVTCGGVSLGGAWIPSGGIKSTMDSLVTVKREQHRTVVTMWSRLPAKPCHFKSKVSYGYPDYTEKATSTKGVFYGGTPSTASPYAPGTKVSYRASQQVMVAHRVSGSKGTWRRYEYRLGSGWVAIQAGTSSIFGPNGVAAEGYRRQNDGKTPAGTYPIKYTFGASNPGTTMLYKKIGSCSWWNENPKSATYNRWVVNCSGMSKSTSERLADYVGRQYKQAAVIGYNYDKPIRYGNGSGAGIFLHYATQYTGGCVGLNNMSELTNTIKWMKPSANPTIVIS